MTQQNNNDQQIFDDLLYFNIMLGAVRGTKRKKQWVGPDFGELTT